MKSDVKSVCPLNNATGAIAWGWLLVLLLVAAAAAVLVYRFPPAGVPTPQPSIARGKIPPMPEGPPATPAVTEPQAAAAPPVSEAAAAPPDDRAAENRVVDTAPPADAAAPVMDATADAAPSSPPLPEPSVDAADASSTGDDTQAPPDAEPASETAGSEPAAAASATTAAVSNPDAAPTIDSAAAPLATENGSPSGPGPGSTDSTVPQADSPAADVDAQPTVKEAPYTVQVGAFHRRQNADTRAAELDWRGYRSYIVERTPKNGKPLYLVRLGRFQTYATAADAASAFTQKEQIQAMVVRTASH